MRLIPNPVDVVSRTVSQAIGAARSLHDSANRAVTDTAKAVRTNLDLAASLPDPPDPREERTPASTPRNDSVFDRIVDAFASWFGASRSVERAIEVAAESGPTHAKASAWAAGAVETLPFGARAAADLGARIGAGLTIVDAVIDVPAERIGEPAIRLRNTIGADLGAHANGALDAGATSRGFGFGADAEAFVGARLFDSLGVALNIGDRERAAANGTIEAWAGMGFLGAFGLHVDERNRVHVEGGVGAGLGIGAALRGEVTIDPTIDRAR